MFEFQRETDGSLSLESAVAQAIGAASVCWEHSERAGVFRDDFAMEIHNALVAEIPRAIVPTEPLLGLATTEQLLSEVRTRIEMDYFSGGGGLGYTTVAGRPE